MARISGFLENIKKTATIINEREVISGFIMERMPSRDIFAIEKAKLSRISTRAEVKPKVSPKIARMLSWHVRKAHLSFDAKTAKRLCSYMIEIFEVKEAFARLRRLERNRDLAICDSIIFSDIHSYEVNTAHEMLSAIFL